MGLWTRGDSFPKGHLLMSREIVGCHCLGKDVSGISWGEDRWLQNVLQCTGQPQARELSSPKCLQYWEEEGLRGHRSFEGQGGRVSGASRATKQCYKGIRFELYVYILLVFFIHAMLNHFKNTDVLTVTKEPNSWCLGQYCGVIKAQ
jgi:hypothetical protein